jgi:hypothetical protein
LTVATLVREIEDVAAERVIFVAIQQREIRNPTAGSN